MTYPYEWDRYRPLFGYPELLAQIKAVERYVSQLLPFIPRGLPVFQSHGIGHSQAIIKNINQIIRASVLNVTPHETFLLYLAAWLHDLGYLHPQTIHNRSMHPSLSVEMLTKDTVIRGLVREEELFSLEIIIRYHGSRADLAEILETSPHFRTPFLAALFRLADAVDIGTDRCPPEVFVLIEDGLDDHCRKHWLAHQNIQECIIAYPFIRILVYDLENSYFRGRIISHLEEDCHSSGVIFERYGFAPMIPVYRMVDPDRQIDNSDLSTVKNRSLASTSSHGQ